MKCIYINDNGLVEKKYQTTGIISAIVVDADARSNIKSVIGEIVSAAYGEDYKNLMLRWADIDAENILPYANLLNLFHKTDALTFEAVVIKDYNNSKKYPSYVELIKRIYERYNQEDIRVFIPPRRWASAIQKLKNMLAEKDIVCEVCQNPLEESRFYQMSNIGAGMLRYYMSDDYFMNIGQKGRPQMVQFALNMKKSKNKIVIHHLP